MNHREIIRFCWMLVAVLVLAIAGCSGASDSGAGDETTSSETGGEHGHAHPSEGPHGGHLIELGGEEYHAEMLDDHATNTITFYILDGSAKKEVAIAEDAAKLNAVVGGEPKSYDLTAVDVKDGKASKFEVTDEALLEALEEDANAKLNLTIEGKPFVGKVEHHEH